MNLHPVNMGDLEGIISAEMLLTFLREAGDLAEEARFSLQYDGLCRDEHEEEKEMRLAYISAVGEVCDRITALLTKGGAS